MPKELLLFDKSLQKIFVFRFIGLNIDSKKRNMRQNCISLLNFLWLNTDIICALMWILGGKKDFKDLTYLTPCLSFLVLGDIKAICFLLNETKVHNLMDNLRDLEETAKNFVHSRRDITIKLEIKFLNTIIDLLTATTSLLFVVFQLTPSILVVVTYFFKGQLDLKLPFLDIYPFNSLNLRYWPFAYVHQVGTAGIAVAAVSASDFLFFTFCIHIKIQFKLLQHQFQEIITYRNVSAVNSIDLVAVRAKFQELIKWHQKIISSANMLEEIYSKPTLFNFLVSALIICLTGFNVTIQTDNKAVVLPSVLFMLVGMSQVFFLCYCGDILISSSMDVSNAVYNSRWYLNDLVMRKNVLSVQTRAQRPCKLTAASFVDVNLKAYMKIISTAWSYFALLRTIYNSRS